ncbi:hypothetical protein V6N11_076893 [Hibiscus sabdariffa]|uniref:Uncharacterized protein n=1 Tax=Hibiscus sabdariffa TaxID=183260 RepID=A0ABR2TBX2_9ROSI
MNGRLHSVSSTDDAEVDTIVYKNGLYTRTQEQYVVLHAFVTSAMHHCSSVSPNDFHLVRMESHFLHPALYCIYNHSSHELPGIDC